MLMTEKEAITKWCPHARVPDDDPNTGGNNRWIRKDDECLCIGSACMAWRWGESAEENRFVQWGDTFFNGAAGDGWERDTSRTGCMADAWKRTRPNRRGYCGAFGKPEAV